MAELGDIADDSHAEVGRLAAQAGVAGLIAVGEEARPVLDGARAETGWHGEADRRAGRDGRRRGA